MGVRTGDILVFTGDENLVYYTKGKHYIIFDCAEVVNYSQQNYFAGKKCYFIHDDVGDIVYFTEEHIEDETWSLLKTIRKNKLEKLKQLV